MKSLSPEMQAHLQNAVTTLATCWRLTRRDGVTLGFTDHDRPLVITSITYEAMNGCIPTAVAGSAGLEVDNLDMEGLLDAEAITEEDILKGLYDFAEIEVFLVNYLSPEAGIILLKAGWLGEVRWNGHYFVAEIRGLTQKLSQAIGVLYSPTCRAELGDARCGVNMTARTVTGAVTDVLSRQVFYDASRLEEAGRFTHGRLEFTSGANNGVVMEVKAYQPGQLTLMLPLPAEVEAGDVYTLQEGCDKYIETCRTRFSNVVNFRGEPHVPGFDRILETAATRNRRG